MKKYNFENILMFRKQFVLTLIALVVAGQVTAQTTLFYESFENWSTASGYELPNNGNVWTAESTVNFWMEGDNINSNAGQPNYSGHCCGGWAEFDTYWTSSGQDWYIQTPTIDLSNISSGTGQLTFYYANTGGSDNLTIQFYNGTSWVNQTPVLPSGYGTFTLRTYNITSTFETSNFKIRFLGYSDYGTSNIGLDEVTVSAACPSFATYYSKSSGNLDDLSTWGSNVDGTGCPPANFTTAGVTYNVHNNAAPTTSGAWVVSGTGSKVVFGDPDVTVSFTAGGVLNFDCDIELANDGTLNLNDNNMNLEGDLIRSSASAVFNPGPSGTNTITFDGGTDQYVNVTTGGGSTPADADLTFYDVVVSNNSTVRLYYKFSNSKKLNINDLNVNSGSTLHFISD